MALRSGELPGQSIFLMPQKSNIRGWLWCLWDRALSSCTRVSPSRFLQRKAKDKSFFSRIIFQYRYQSIPPFFARLSILSCAASKCQVLPGFISSQSSFKRGSESKFDWFISSIASIFSFSVLGYQIWQGPLRSYEKQPQNINFIYPFHRLRVTSSIRPSSDRRQIL